MATQAPRQQLSTPTFPSAYQKSILSYPFVTFHRRHFEASIEVYRYQYSRKYEHANHLIPEYNP